MNRKNDSPCGIGPLQEALEHIFIALLNRKEFDDALDFLDSCINKYPDAKIINSIIFNILMDENCNEKDALAAGSYIMNILHIYPPSDQIRRAYYKTVLTPENHMSENMWNVFRLFVESSYCHHKIYHLDDEATNNQIKPVKHPHCEILIDFYVSVLAESYDYHSAESTFHEKKEKSLVAELFWPSAEFELNAAKENPRQLFGWIQVIYKEMNRIEKLSVFRTLHQLFNLVVKCIIDNGYVWDRTSNINTHPDSLICNSPCLLDVVKVVINTCSAAFESHEHVKQFMNYITYKPLRLKLCEYALYELLYSRQPSERNFTPTTLLSIINVYMFPKQSKRGRPKKALPNEKKEKIPKINLKLNRKGDTILHEACRSGKPGDLFQSLYSTPAPDVNAKNSVGYTPLHVACISDTTLCAKVLIDECSSGKSKQKLNWNVVDEDGCTVLHVAISRNAIDITRMILKKGGIGLLNTSDFSMRKPYHYSTTKEMEKLLKDFLPTDADSDKDNECDTIYNRNIPVMETFKKNAIYFHTLQFLLGYYFDIYHIYDILSMMQNREDTLSIKVLQHEEKVCPHFMPWTGNELCSIDYAQLRQFPDSINHFIDCATKHSKENRLNLNLEILPLKLFSTTLEFKKK